MDGLLRRVAHLLCVVLLLAGCDRAVVGVLELGPPPDPTAEYETVARSVAMVVSRFGLAERDFEQDASGGILRTWGDGRTAVELARKSEGRLTVTIMEFPATYFSAKTASVWQEIEDVLRGEFGDRVVVAMEPRVL